MGIGPQHLHRVRPDRRRVRPAGRQRQLRVHMDARAQVDQHPVRVARVERLGVAPAFAERVLQIRDGRPVHLGLDVVPGWALPVHRRHRLRLRVASVVRVVPTAVREVDAAHEGDRLPLRVGRAEHDQLLVVGAAGAHPLVEQYLAPGGVHAVADLLVLLLVHPDLIEVGAPDQATHEHATLRGRAEQVREADRRVAVDEDLIRVALPIGEGKQVTGLEGLHGADQPREVFGPVHQRIHPVAGGPGAQIGAGVAPLFRTEEPVVEPRGARAHEPGR